MTGVAGRAGWLAIAGLVLLTGCSDRPEEGPEPDLTAVPQTEPRSIFRPEFQVEPITEESGSLGPLEMRIGFSEGVALTEKAVEALSRLRGSEQVKRGGAIELRGHSDSGGSDSTNLRISRARAEAVRDWLVEHGIDEDRISVIPFGEQNPVAPNALPDGSPNEEGRRTNRRVDVHVAGEAKPLKEEKPTLAETLSDPPSDMSETQN